MPQPSQAVPPRPLPPRPPKAAPGAAPGQDIVAIFYPFSQFCEINISLLSLQTQPNTAPNLFQRGAEYGKYAGAAAAAAAPRGRLRAVPVRLGVRLLRGGGLRPACGCGAEGRVGGEAAGAHPRAAAAGGSQV